MTDLAPSLVRTAVPIVVGPLIARFGFDVTDPNTLAVVTAAASWLYYVLIRLIETRYPSVGYLLGIAKAPAYSPEPAPSPGPGENVEAVVVPDGGEVSLLTALVVVLLLLLIVGVVR